MGSYAGRYITSDSNNAGGNYNICIGRATGPNINSDRIHDSNRIYINTLGAYKEEESIIYGDQSTGNQDLTFNADVVISKGTTNSDGTLLKQSTKEVRYKYGPVV